MRLTIKPALAGADHLHRIMRRCLCSGVDAEIVGFPAAIKGLLPFASRCLAADRAKVPHVVVDAAALPKYT